MHTATVVLKSHLLLSGILADFQFSTKSTIEDIFNLSIVVVRRAAIAITKNPKNLLD